MIPSLADAALAEALAAAPPGIHAVELGGPTAPLPLLLHPTVAPLVAAALGPSAVLDAAWLVAGVGLPAHPPLFATRPTPPFALRLVVSAACTVLSDVREPLPAGPAQLVLTYARPWFADLVSAPGVPPFAVPRGLFAAADDRLKALLARAGAALAQAAPPMDARDE